MDHPEKFFSTMWRKLSSPQEKADKRKSSVKKANNPSPPKHNDYSLWANLKLNKTKQKNQTEPKKPNIKKNILVIGSATYSVSVLFYE